MTRRLLVIFGGCALYIACITTALLVRAQDHDAKADEAGVSEVEFEQTKTSLLARLRGQPIFEYVFSHPEIARPFFHRLKTPSGVQVTRNHPPVEGQDPTDHADMHPGLWIAFADIAGADFWRNKGRVEQEKIEADPDAAPGGFTVVNQSIDGERALCRETTHYRVYSWIADKGYLLTIDCTLRAEADGVDFGDPEEMGLGLRVATSIAVKGGAGTITNSEGGKDEQGTWGKQAAWCDYSAVLDGRRVGVTLMAHPANPHPSWFHARDYGLLVANPFGQKAGAPARLSLKKGESLRLRFGVLVYDTPEANPPDLAREYEAYVKLTK